MATKILFLIRNTTWCCGKIQRFIVNSLRRKASKEASLNEILNEGSKLFKRHYVVVSIYHLRKRNIVGVNRE